ncbi:MAG: 4-hydroxy-tetrahydrodipicolinate reductase [Bacteroidales bacterium]|jgi:4-hydroxy-tetrahydrodipicolinate reductase|nr:4-hydroxy-tetrahydrodipicolinate reductase [Bacteroidales bacterium]MDD3166391.1 4-hydroxy-tetrahydrodipicolinate reductase [Bacteroidales bacterium]MDD4770974.1 4-hydroxy-tetrahydrodipicolinate reductase [Bacteroidales bacterium]
MKIALIGYGKMGHEIERIALARGHEIVQTIDVNNLTDMDSERFRSADVVIEFTRPDSALANYRKCFSHHLPIVSGTTGWLEHLPEIKEACASGETFFYASNFSLGVNLFFALNARLAEMMNGFPEYDVCMKEIHHTQKMDAPSGTAISLAEDILERLDRKTTWVKETANERSELAIRSERLGEVPGFHEVTYQSEIDSITISHDAKNRSGFALGAVLAAEYTVGNKGFLGMKDMLGF